MNAFSRSSGDSIAITLMRGFSATILSIAHTADRQIGLVRNRDPVVIFDHATTFRNYLRAGTRWRPVGSARPGQPESAARQGDRAGRFLGLHLRQLYTHPAVSRR